jgi:hypothetical protein
MLLDSFFEDLSETFIAHHYFPVKKPTKGQVHLNQKWCQDNYGRANLKPPELQTH